MRTGVQRGWMAALQSQVLRPSVVGVFFLGVLLVPAAYGQSADREPHIGYAFPAGGQQGTVVQVLVGGQRLGAVRSVYVSGEGVTASVLQYSKPLSNDQLKEIRMLLGKLMRMRRNGEMTETVEFPDHPLLRNVNQMSARELDYWTTLRFNTYKKQQNMQLADMAILEVTIAADAPLGERELRLGTPAGLTNAARFCIGAVPEVVEREPNARDTNELGCTDTPMILNGQVMPGDADRFRFRARQGQQLVFTTAARALMPYLADAVPGWFQPTLTLFDPDGKEVAFDDDYRFDPDPVLCCAIPRDGEYEVEIRDSIYRGRDDFVYRVAVGEQPFITHLFPLGAEIGTKAVASVAGWNLPADTVTLDTQAGADADAVRYLIQRTGPWLSNRVPYMLDTLPQCMEHRSNDTVRKAQKIKPPQIVNGRIEQPGDVDVFRFKGHAEEKVIAEVYARRMHSPLDSVLRLMDASGKVLAWNDDNEDKGEGLLTHHADSYLCAQLPKNGVYYLQLSDTQRQGGEDYAYRLRLGPPRPDFALRMTPSNLNLRPGRAAAFTVYALRKDGFDGDIDVALKDAPAGLTIDGARIPRGRDSIRMTLTVASAIEQPVALQMEGRAQIADETITRPVVPCDNMMQAFAYWHLVPSQELLATVLGGGKGRAPKITVNDPAPMRIAENTTAKIAITIPKAPFVKDLRLELSDPPKGITLEDVTAVPGSVTLVLKNDAAVMKAGYTDNLIVEAFKEDAPQPSDAKPKKQKTRFSLGVLPAIPFEIVP